MPAIFLDRDGTVIIDKGYLGDPAGVELLPGAAQAIVKLNHAGYACVIVTNQSGIGRGYYSEADYQAVNAEMKRQLNALNATLAAEYHCPHAPSADADNQLTTHPDRKPNPGMLLTAASELNLDISKSWMIGDRDTDILAGHSAGCKASVLIKEDVNDTAYDKALNCYITKSLIDIVPVILGN